MSALSQFVGGGGGAGVPVGAMVKMPAPAGVRFMDGAAEYLRCGALTPYTPAYKAAMSRAPHLRVFGGAAKLSYDRAQIKGDLPTGKFRCYLAHVGGNYVAFGASPAGASVNWRAAMDSSPWGATSGGSGLCVPRQFARPAVSPTHLVIPYLNSKIMATSDGKNLRDIGGLPGPSTSGSRGALAYGDGMWAYLPNNGKFYFCRGDNPLIQWQSRTHVANGIFYGAAAIGRGRAVFAGKGGGVSLFWASSIDEIASGNMRDIASLLPKTETAGINDVVYDGNVFLMLGSNGVYRTRDGQSVEACDLGLDLRAVNFQVWGGFIPNVQIGDLMTSAHLSTDGQGTAAVSLSGGGIGSYWQCVLVTRDGGARWTPLYTWTPVTDANGLPVDDGVVLSWANGHWWYAPTGDRSVWLDLGADLSTPDLVGMRSSFGFGDYARVR